MANILNIKAPFSERNRSPTKQTEPAGAKYSIHSLGRKLKEKELAEMFGVFDFLIKGTEDFTML